MICMRSVLKNSLNKAFQSSISCQLISGLKQIILSSTSFLFTLSLWRAVSFLSLSLSVYNYDAMVSK